MLEQLSVNLFSRPILPMGLHAARSGFRKIFDFLLPPRCLCCMILIEEPQSLCNKCWKNLDFIHRPFCEICAFPFEIELQPGSICGRCARNTSLYGRSRSALRYNEGSKPLILRFKHSDATYLTPLLSKWMCLAGQDVLETADYLVPVPLHWTRLFKRQYNQAALLVLGVAKLSGRTAVVNMLHRNRATPSQGNFKAQARKQNVAGAFEVHPTWLERIKGKNILLIDDVLTSGATLQSCTVPLLKAGAQQVDVLTLARVV